MSQDIVGLEELLKQLKDLPLNVQANFGKRAVKKSAEIMASQIVANILEEDLKESGDLAASVEPGKVITKKKYGSIKVDIKIGQFYGRFWEYGYTDQYGEQHGARPFARTAIVDKKEEIVALFGEEVGGAIKRFNTATERAARKAGR